MIKNILNVINGSVSIIKTTNATVYLSDGTQWNRSKFHHDRVLVSSLLQQQSALYTNTLSQFINKATIAKNKTIDSIKETTKIAEHLKQAIPVPVVASEVSVVAADKMMKPFATNRRFVCGYTYEYAADGKCMEDSAKFVMLFWNYNKEFSNSHSDIDEYYKEHHNRHFRCNSGGFYMSNGHNNSRNSNKFYLFGRSDTYGNFTNEIPDIIQYGLDNNLVFIIGRTDFTNDAVDANGNYVGSDALDELFQQGINSCSEEQGRMNEARDNEQYMEWLREQGAPEEDYDDEDPDKYAMQA